MLFTANVEMAFLITKFQFANRALAELKGAGELIPNQGVLINAIVLQEAKLSSEIENVVTTNDKLYRASPAVICSQNEHIVEICRKKSVFWTYPRNMSKTWTSLGVAGLCFGAIPLIAPLQR